MSGGRSHPLGVSTVTAAWWRPDLEPLPARGVQIPPLIGVSVVSAVWQPELELTPGVRRPKLVLVRSFPPPPLLLPLPLGAQCSMAQAASSPGPSGGYAPFLSVGLMAGSFRHSLSPAAGLRFFGEVKTRPLCVAAGQALWWGLCRLPWGSSVFHPRQVGVRDRGASDLCGGGRCGAAVCFDDEVPSVALGL
jgi:hypothetical protein